MNSMFSFRAFPSLLWLLAFSLVIPHLHSAQNANHLLQQASQGLSLDFFKKVFPRRNLLKAYELAQNEDFLLNSFDVITNDMFDLMNQGKLSSHPHNRVLVDFDRALVSLGNRDQRGSIIEEWRARFLSRFTAYLRYQNSLKPRWKLSLSNDFQFDSNVNRTPDGDPGPASHNDKDDLIDTLSMNFIWKPFENSKRYQAGPWRYQQVTNAVRTIQSQVKENEVLIMDTEAQVSRKFKNYIMPLLKLSYRYRHFNSTNATGTELNANFAAHRFKTDYIFKRIKPNISWLKSTNTSLTMSAEDKRHFASTDKTKNALTLAFIANQNFTYRAGRKQANRFKTSFEYSTYRTDNSAASDYKYYKITLNHKHRHRYDFWKNSFNYSQSLSYRMKNFPDFIGGEQDEDIIKLQAKVSTKLHKSLSSSITLNQLWKDNDITNGTSTKAKQFQASFGLRWSTP